MRTSRYGRGLVAVLLGLAVWWGASAATSFDAQLRKADEIRSSDPAQFQRILEQLDRDATSATPAQRQQLQLLHGYRLILTGDFQGSIAELKRLLDQTTDVNLRYRAGALLANNYAVTRQFSEGFAALDRTLALRERVTDPDLRQRGLLTAAIFYNQLGQYELGRHYADMILATEASERSRCFAGSLRLESLQNLGKLPAQDEPFQSVVSQCLALREGVAAGLARGYLARKWHAEGKTAQAIALLERHLKDVEATRYPRLIAEVHSLLAEYRLLGGNLAAAEQQAHSAIAQSKGNTYSLPTVTAYRILYDIDMRRRDTAAALAHYRAYAEADKAYLNDIKARELAFQLARHETLQKTQQIELLDRKNQVLQLQQRVDKQATQNTQLIAALLALLLASIGYWAYKTKRMQMSFRRLAETDSLTGISNRHHFTRLAEEALAYCAKTGEDVAVIMFDLDNFKSVNDRFGHVAGDCVLQRVAEACKSQCRKNDRFGRLGGEEFAMLLVGCDLHAAAQMAQACRARVAEIDTTECGHRFQVTASFGVTAASLSGYEFARLLSHADQMLYRSKREGRNRVSVFSAEALDTVFVTDAPAVEQHA
jgi:diguanylate cyclase (GGDEF)-like protein